MATKLDIKIRNGHLMGSPDDNLIYFITATGATLEARSTAAGQTIWTHTFSEGVSTSNPILANGILYYNSDENLYAFNAQSGKSIYTAPLIEGLSIAGNTSIMSISNNVIYIVYSDGDSEGSFAHAYEATSGRFLGKLPARPTTVAPVYDPLVIANGQLYVLYNANELVVYGQEAIRIP